jgi:CHRD domain-containing protein
MRRTWAIRVLAACAVLGFTISAASADASSSTHLTARLSGFNETGPPILSNGTATVTATINAAGTEITYRETFSGLSAPVVQSHFHFAPRGLGGGVFLFLCTNLTPPAGIPAPPACPANGGTVTGTLTAANVIGLPAQNLKAGDLAGALRIIRSGSAYANIHTTAFPQGEIRGQVNVGDE